MAGLVVAARLRELGMRPFVHEKGARLGGSMLLSSCVIWRHRDWDDFRCECPDGDEQLQRLIWERLDDAIAWLESLGPTVVDHETGNPLTEGKRFDPRSLTESLARRSGTVELSSDGCVAARREPDAPLVLCTGGFGGSQRLVAEHIAPAAPLRLRANPWSRGEGLELALERGAGLSHGLGEFYGRNMPDAPWDEAAFVAASQLFGRFARIYDRDGVEFFASGDVSWSETNVVQATARRPGALAYYLLDETALRERVRGRAVSDMVSTSATVDPADLPFEAPDGTVTAVRVTAAITHTIGGLKVDSRARALRPDGSPVEGLYAAGVDAGGVATGGYASGLAQALVLGLAVAEELSGVS
jgi:hypothetical protein